MLNHECDITKLLAQRKAIAIAKDPITDVDDLVNDTTLLYGTPKAKKSGKKKDASPSKPRKPKGTRELELESELDKAKGQAKQNRDKLIKTTQEKLQSLAERETKAKQPKPPSVASIVAKTIATHHDKSPEKINAEVHKALGTVPSKEIDSYLDRQIDLYRARRADMFKRLADNSKKKRLENKGKKLEAIEAKASRDAEKEAERISREFEQDLTKAQRDADRAKTKAEIEAYKADEATKKTERDAFRAKWKEEQAKYNAEQRKAKSDARKSYVDLWRDLTNNDPEWQNANIKNRLLENILKKDADPKAIKRDFTAITGLAYLGHGDIKAYLEQIEKAKEIKDPYEKTVALRLIDRQLQHEVPNTVARWFKSAIRINLLTSPSGGLKDSIGTELEGQLLSGAMPQLPNVKLFKRFYNEALQGINTMGADVTTGDYGTSPADALRLPPEFRKVLGDKLANKADKVLEKYATVQDALRNSVAKMVYQQHYDYLIKRYGATAKTDLEQQTLRDYAQSAGANATYSPVGKLSKSNTFGYHMAGIEATITEKLSGLNQYLDKTANNKANGEITRMLASVADVGLTAFMPFAGFMVRLGVRSVNMTVAPYVMVGKLAQLATRAYQARDIRMLNVLNTRAFMTVEESIQTDAIMMRGIVSSVGVAGLAVLIDLGVLMVPDPDGDDDDRLEKQVGMYGVQFNWSQLVRLAMGAPPKTQENDLVLGMSAFPMTSYMAYNANALRKGVKLWDDPDKSRVVANTVAKGLTALFLDTPANQTMKKLFDTRNEEGEKDIGKGSQNALTNLGLTLIPLIVRRPVEVALNPKTKKPDKPKATLPQVVDVESGDVAPMEVKHERERAIEAEMGMVSYLLANVLNSTLNPMTAEKLSHAKAMVADMERRNPNKESREFLGSEGYENKLKAKPFKYDPELDTAITQNQFRKLQAVKRLERTQKPQERP